MSFFLEVSSLQVGWIFKPAPLHYWTKKDFLLIDNTNGNGGMDDSKSSVNNRDLLSLVRTLATMFSRCVRLNMVSYYQKNVRTYLFLQDI